jgi:hypothetical protein
MLAMAVVVAGVVVAEFANHYHGRDIELRKSIPVKQRTSQAYLAKVKVDLAGQVTLEWSGKLEGSEVVGPFPCVVGGGDGTHDCNDCEVSRQLGSLCTPIGEWTVEGFNERLPSSSACRFVTWFDRGRAIGLHSIPELTPGSKSSGCVRLQEQVARIIYDNALIGETIVVVEGVWAPPDERPSFDDF